MDWLPQLLHDKLQKAHISNQSYNHPNRELKKKTFFHKRLQLCYLSYKIILFLSIQITHSTAPILHFHKYLLFFPPHPGKVLQKEIITVPWKSLMSTHLSCQPSNSNVKKVEFRLRPVDLEKYNRGVVISIQGLGKKLSILNCQIILSEHDIFIELME